MWTTWFILGGVVAMVALTGSVSASEEAKADSADEALAALKAGNARFVSGQMTRPHTDAARRKETAEHGQHPFATILTCSDSRVAVEQLFDQGIGDVFVVRVPGNVCNTDEIGAIEYGVGHLKTPLCVVLGHTKCGAVTGVATGASLHGNLARLVNNIRHAVVRTRRDQPGLEDEAFVEAVAKANVRQSIADLKQGSPEIKELAGQNQVRIAGAMYDVASGQVTWLDEPAP